MNETIKTELYHKWSASQKHNYNVEYYKKNKDKWEKYKWEKYNHSERRALGDNASRLSRAENMLDFAKSRYEKAYNLRREAFDAGKKNKDMAARAQAAGIPKAAEALRSTAYDKYGEAHDYLDQQNYIEKKQVKPREGDVAYLRTMRDKGYGAASSRPVSSARVDKTVGSHDRGDYKYVSKSFEKVATKADELRRKANWKTAPIKNKATRKAKEFVSNWKSGASSISSAAKSASSKVGKSFLDTKIATRVTNFKSPSGTTTTKSSITIGDALKGSKKPKRTLSGQPNGFVENWKQGAGDIVGAFKKKKRK